MKALLRIITSLALCIAPTVPCALGQGQMGVNYNGTPHLFDADGTGPSDPTTNLNRSGTTWVRAFYDVTQLIGSTGGCSTSTIAADQDLQALSQISAHGYKTILNLKYDFGGAEPPAQPGTSDSQPYKNISNYVDITACSRLILAQAYPYVDLIVSGNEPFITGTPGDENVTTFCKEMTNLVIGYNDNNGSTRTNPNALKIYVGAFNNLEETTYQTQAAKDLITYALNTADVTGIDLHLHVSSFNGASGSSLTAAVTWAQQQFGTSKPMMSSEFSLVNYFEGFLGDALSSEFEGKYSMSGVSPLTVRGFINFAIANPVPQQEWWDFQNFGDGPNPNYFTNVAKSSGTQKNFLYEVNQLFFNTTGNNFTVATYGIVGTSGTLPNNSTQPWLLNALYCRSACQPSPGTEYSVNALWIGDFQAQQ